MRILVISDIHANLIALRAVIADAAPYDAVWCLGDLVGYGPDPNDCIELVQNQPGLICILGNHDAATLGAIDVENFNPEARMAVQWTMHRLQPPAVQFLERLPEKIVQDDVTLAHGSPRHPVWEYLLDARTAAESFQVFTTNFCFVGHTHLPAIFHQQETKRSVRLSIPEPGVKVALQARSILNPGSVGQPRDRDPRAAYAIYEPDSGSFTFRRVEYDVAAVQSRMLAAGMSQRHISRLAAGW